MACTIDIDKINLNLSNEQKKALSEISGENINDLLFKILQITGENGISFGGTFLSPLNFYHAASKSEIDKALDHFIIKKTPPSSVTWSAVTKVSEKVYGGSPVSSNKMIEFYKKFRTDVGTAFHKCMEDYIKLGSLDKSSTVNDFIEIFKKVKENLNKDPNLLNNAPYGLTNFMQNLEHANDDFFDKLAISVRTAVSNFIDTDLKGLTLKYEVPLWDMNTRLQGRADLITYDDAGNIIIYDFKTSYNNFVSDRSKTGHYIQLSLYREMLAAKLGIDPRTIKIKNLNFTYGLDGINTPILTDLENELSTKIKAEGLDYVTRFYPTQAKKIELSEAEKITKETDSIRSIIASKDLNRRCSAENITKRIENAYKNEQNIWLKFLNEKVTKIDKEGDLYKFYKDKELLEYNDKSAFTMEEIINFESEAVRKAGTLATRSLINMVKERNYEASRHLIDKFTKGNLAAWALFSKYTAGNWRYIENPALEHYNIITMQNIVDGSYDFVVTINDSTNSDYIPDPKKNLLSNFFVDQKELKNIKEAQNLPPASIENLTKLQALVAIVKFKDTLGKGVKINSFKFYNTINGTSDLGLDTQQYLTALKILQYEANTNPDKIEHAELLKSIADGASSIAFASDGETAARAVSDALLVLGEIDGTIVTGTLQKDFTIEQLERIRSDIERLYPAEISTLRDHEATSEIQMIYAEISKYLLSLEDWAPPTMYEMHNRSITFAESIVAGVNLLVRGETERFTKRGLQLTGLAQGLSTSISYASPDELVRRFNALYDTYALQIVEEGSKELQELVDATRRFLKAQNIVADRLRGNHDKYYENLLQHNKNGEINPSMLFKNPYDTANSGSYIAEGQYYAEVLLWTLNRHKLVGVLSKDNLKLSYEEFKKCSEFKDYKQLLAEDTKYLEVPLIRKEGFRGFTASTKDIFSGKITVKQYFKNASDRLKQFVEPVILNEEQAEQRDEAIKKMEIYNPFVEGAKNRTSKTENTSVNNWVLNLSRIASEYVFASYKEIFFTKLLKTVDKQLMTIRLMEITTGRDLSNQVNALLDRVKVSVYNKALTDAEDEDLIKAMGVVKSATSYAKIAGRWALFAKEMVLGRIRNTAAILSKQITQDEGREITFKHLLEAAKNVFGGEFFADDNKKFKGPLGNKGPGDFGFVDQINNTYLINDRDLNTVGETLNYDRYGLGNWGTRMLYLNVVKPDWFNRMIIFIAKMHADGTYNAHSLVDGHLVYDMSKDERVSYFWKYRNNPSAASDQKKFLEQKSFYLLEIQQFAKEGYAVTNGENGTEYSEFPRAYTSAENDSIKEQIGLIYGYYGHEERANMQKGLWWIMHTQFLTFLPGEIRKYFAKGGINSSVTRVVHLVDPATKKKLFWKPIYAADGSFTGVTKKITTENDSGIDPETNKLLQPVLERVHNPIEGLAVSFGKTVGRVCRGKFEEIKEDKQALKNSELFLFNMLFAAIIAAIFKMLTDIGIDSSENPGIGIAMDTMQRTANELDVFKSIVEPISGFGLAGMDFLTTTFTKAASTIGSEDYNLIDFANDTFSVISDTHVVN